MLCRGTICNSASRVVALRAEGYFNARSARQTVFDGRFLFLYLVVWGERVAGRRAFAGFFCRCGRIFFRLLFCWR